MKLNSAASGSWFSMAMAPLALGLMSATVNADGGAQPAGDIRALSFGDFINLGDIPVGFRSVALINVTSVGNAPTTIVQFSLPAARAPLAQILADGCAGKVLQPGRVCRVAVAYMPPIEGPFSATVEVESDATAGDLQRLAVFDGASASSVRALDLSAYGVEFGALPTGGSSAQEIVVTSVGDAPVSITTVVRAGGDNFDFTIIRDTCSGSTLAPHQNCLVGVDFSPTASGLRAALITISSNADGVLPAQAYLAGTGDTLFRSGFDSF